MSESVPTWKHVTAWVLDVLLVFLGVGYPIALMTGNTTAGGFQLEGAPALALFAIVIAYFVVMNRLGGTIMKRVFRIPPRQASGSSAGGTPGG